MIVSVPSFGDSFFIAGNNPDLDNEYDEFPSPHSGILFLLIVLQKAIRKARHSFRPLIRGFFFYVDGRQVNKGDYGGFRPLIRGFFFYPVVMICRQV